MIDIHSHILPGVDDGSKSWEETLEMARIALDDGVTTVVATPHMMGAFQNDSTEIRTLVQETNERLRMAGVDLTLVAGGEWFLEYGTGERIDRGHLLTYGDDNKYALVEWSTTDTASSVDRILFEIEVRGITPIIAHAERFIELVDDDGMLMDWIERGRLLQVNAVSLTPPNRKGSLGVVAECAEKLVQGQFAHFIGSDAHGAVRRPPGLSAAYHRVTELVDADYAHMLCKENPQRMLAGETVVRRTPVTVKKRPGLLSRLLRRS